MDPSVPEERAAHAVVIHDSFSRVRRRLVQYACCVEQQHDLAPVLRLVCDTGCWSGGRPLLLL